MATNLAPPLKCCPAGRTCDPESAGLLYRSRTVPDVLKTYAAGLFYPKDGLMIAATRAPVQSRSLKK